MQPAGVDTQWQFDGTQVVLRLPGGPLRAATAASLARTAHQLTEDRAVRVVIVTTDRKSTRLNSSHT